MDKSQVERAHLRRGLVALMTTAAAMLAGVPMMFGDGTGSELRKPLGYSMVGRFALSQILTLYKTPVVYLYLARLQAWVQGKRRQHAPQAAEIHTVGGGVTMCSPAPPGNGKGLMFPFAAGAQFPCCAAANPNGVSRLIVLARFATLSVPRPAAGL
jgi:AcrB/AcrD/AcrF family protein